jgi:hypothetical protein
MIMANGYEMALGALILSERMEWKEYAYTSMFMMMMMMYI